MIVWICTDMEGLAGVDDWEQCYATDDEAPIYLDGRRHLTDEVNAAVAGCFDAGATEVRVLDGHGRNRFKGFVTDRLDPRAKQMGVRSWRPLRWEGLDESVSALAIIGQHAMAGTLNGFLDHTQMPKEICRFTLNGEEHGEMSQMALYAGAFGVPLVYTSGDEALCEETRRLFPHALTTPTKRGTGWATCELYPPDEVRLNIRRDIATAMRAIDPAQAWKLSLPIEVGYEYAYSGLADRFNNVPGVRRPHARSVAWDIHDPRDVFTAPTA
ncbi:M55 family metallopeptidase [Phycisphaerales bacterium AB-hyl4]|uniref:M55 family metallopeptidase n=1 Tax=Natronomicrosphaera hydrolytica TaxID=3242702 RepID=A0ABV4U9R2_9BACT